MNDDDDDDDDDDETKREMEYRRVKMWNKRPKPEDTISQEFQISKESGATYSRQQASNIHC